MNTTITEIIPKDMPDWFKQDMEDGQVFARMVKRYDAQDKEITYFQKKCSAKDNELKVLKRTLDESMDDNVKWRNDVAELKNNNNYLAKLVLELKEEVSTVKLAAKICLNNKEGE